ncbi:hypothetical protein J3E69DRAFT_357255 [Trichoderma sp. SZMC 28015]
MFLGFSLGDFIDVAQLAYQLSKTLTESKGANEEYQTLIAELNVVHRVLLQNRSWMAIMLIRTFRRVDFGNLPLEPIPKLQAIAKKEQLEDMSKRLTQIRQLPLEIMTRYCKDIPGDRKNCRMLKDYWASENFRAWHREYYIDMIRDDDLTNGEAIPSEERLEGLPHPTRTTEFSPEKWILLEDIISDIPIESDDYFIYEPDSLELTVGGPIMIQRFVVVREDSKRCLCLGIHTYAKQGCGDQSDQELHGVLSSGKTPPPLKPNETKIILSPVRMKLDHPSLALSSTARIHYGRAYEIDHRLSVQPLGLIHPTSMEVLLGQFEVNLDNVDLQQRVKDVTHSKEAAYTSINIVKDMRRSMEKVLGPKLALPRDYYDTNQW